MDADTDTMTLGQLLVSYPLRLCGYAAATLVVFQLVYTASVRQGASVGAENGPIEIAQVVLALLGAAGLFLAARVINRPNAGLVICGAIVTYAAARESDAVFEALFFDDAYKYLVGVPMAILVFNVLAAQRRTFIRDAAHLLHQPAATLFVVAGIYLCFVVQLLDRPTMWTGLEVTEQNEAMRASIEESMELFAYLLLAFSGIEAVMFARASVAQAAVRAEADQNQNQNQDQNQDQDPVTIRIAA